MTAKILHIATAVRILRKTSVGVSIESRWSCVNHGVNIGNGNLILGNLVARYTLLLNYVNYLIRGEVPPEFPPEFSQMGGLSRLSS